jgi:hypothetical protein
MEDNTEPDDKTREAELAEAGKSHAELDADREDVAEHYEEMTELGAHLKGEGEIK